MENRQQGLCRSPGALIIRFTVLLLLTQFSLFTAAQNASDPEAKALLILSGDYRIALQEFDNMLALDSSLHIIHYYKGIAHVGLMQYHQADRQFASAIRYDSLNPAYFEARASCNFEMERYDQAEVLIRKAMQLDPVRIPAQLLLGRILQRQQRIAEAIRLYLELAESDLLNPFYPKQTGLLYQRIDSLETAARFLEISLALDSLDLQVIVRLGQIYVRLEQEHLAESGQLSPNVQNRLGVMNHGIRIDSTQALLYRCRGGLFLMQALYLDAYQDFKCAIEWGDSTAYSFRHAGLSCFHRSEYQEAAPWFQKTIEKDSLDPQAWYYLGFCYKWEERIDLAIECLEQALRLSYSPSATSVHSGLGQFYSFKRNHAEAIRHYERALELNPEDAVPMAQLGILIEESGGDKRKAKEYYLQYLDNPGREIFLVEYIASRVQAINEWLFMQGELSVDKK